MKQFTKETKDKAVEMYIDGKSAGVIAEEIGCSGKAVLNWVANAGFDTRGRGGCRNQEPPKKGPVDRKQINPLLLNLAGDNNLAPYIGKEIVKMTPREIFEFLELLGIEGEITIKQKVKLRKKTPALPW